MLMEEIQEGLLSPYRSPHHLSHPTLAPAGQMSRPVSPALRAYTAQIFHV